MIELKIILVLLLAVLLLIAVPTWWIRIIAI